jgi:hypothetical protein
MGGGREGGRGARGAQEGVAAGVVPGRVDPAVRAFQSNPAQRQALPHPLRSARPPPGRVTAGRPPSLPAVVTSRKQPLLLRPLILSKHA